MNVSSLLQVLLITEKGEKFKQQHLPPAGGATENPAPTFQYPGLSLTDNQDMVTCGLLLGHDPEAGRFISSLNLMMVDHLLTAGRTWS